MKRQNLWTILIAFLFGQLIQLVTIALSRYLYISDPVMVCITVGIMTTALVVLTAVFTLMDQITAQEPAHMAPQKPVVSGLKPIFNKRPVYDTDPEDIDEVDRNIAKEQKGA